MSSLPNTAEVQQQRNCEPLTWLLLPQSCCKTDTGISAAGQHNSPVPPRHRSAGAHAEFEDLFNSRAKLKLTHDCFVAQISACDPGHKAYGRGPEASRCLQLSEFSWKSPAYAHHAAQQLPPHYAMGWCAPYTTKASAATLLHFCDSLWTGVGAPLSISARDSEGKALCARGETPAEQA